LITADQILIHLIGDYLTQSDWMASQKVKRFAPAAIHALIYSIGFLVFRPSLAAWLVIAVSHFLIDRYRLARYVVWFKNGLAPIRRVWWPADIWIWRLRDSTPNPPWALCRATGYPPDRPQWLSVWLLIIADNVIHLIINGVALRFLP
jgi:hypothetical protein